jgi:uncharacterized protein (DUF885 family)
MMDLNNIAKQFPILLNACLALTMALPGIGEPTRAPAQQLDAFYAAEWEYQLAHHPEMATYVGDGRFNNQLGDYSAAGAARSAEHAAAQLKRLRLLPVDGLTENQKISRDMMLRQLSAEVEAYRLKEWEMPVNQKNGVHLEIAGMYSQMPFNTMQDYRNYIDRLKAVPRVFDQEMEVMRLGTHDHLMQPRYLLEKVATQCEGIADGQADQSPFALPLAKFPATIGDADRQSLRADLLATITKDVLPSYKRFAIFVHDTYAPAGRSDSGIWALPNGVELYRNAIREHVQTSMTPDEIHREGLRQVQRIQAEMLALAQSQGFHDLASFHAHIQADPKLHGTSGEQLLTLYQSYEVQAHAKLSEVVPVPPPVPLDVIPMDSFRAPTDVPADYSPGSVSGARPGRVNVNLYNPTGRLLLNVEAIAYHEGLPGHHLQFSFADGLRDIPAFRRFASYDAYSEGWALYAEQLGHELGFYHDPYSEYGRLENEMWRSVRLVVDTGVHDKHWTRQQMIDYFHQYTAMDDQNIDTEVDRYICWPGQALSYRLGQMKILDLRERARVALGSRFDLRRFHQQVLALGPVPLDVLDESIQRWIDREAGAAQ